MPLRSRLRPLATLLTGEDSDRPVLVSLPAELLT